jgi:hypothetical protein
MSIHDLERRIAEFYASVVPPRAPDRVLEAAMATVETTPQRRAFISAPRGFPDLNTFARLATAAVALTVLGFVGYAALGQDRSPDAGGMPELPDIVVTEANVPVGLTVHRTVRGVDALRTSGAVPTDVVGLVDAIETSFDGDEEHEGDHEDLYSTFGAVFDTVADAERAFDAAVVLHESADGWGLPAATARVEHDPSLGLGDMSVHYAQGSDYGYPEISVYLWRVGNVLLHAVDFHPYDRPALLESIVRSMDARAKGG